MLRGQVLPCRTALHVGLRAQILKSLSYSLEGLIGSSPGLLSASSGERFYCRRSWQSDSAASRGIQIGFGTVFAAVIIALASSVAPSSPGAGLASWFLEFDPLRGFRFRYHCPEGRHFLPPPFCISMLISGLSPCS